MQGWEKHETVILINKWEETSVFTLYRRQSSRKYPQYFGIRFHETANLVPWQFSARWSNSTHSHCSFLFLNSFDTWLTSWKKKKNSAPKRFSPLPEQASCWISKLHQVWEVEGARRVVELVWGDGCHPFWQPLGGLPYRKQANWVQEASYCHSKSDSNFSVASYGWSLLHCDKKL